MKTIRVGGVPEHFNLPWHLCLEDGDFEYEKINLEWQDFPDGTGAMNKALRNKEIDVAVILTEGIIKDITEGNPSRIIQTYVGSPLIWGIHVANNSRFRNLEELKGSKAAISRKGSGSHLMTFVNAKNQGWPLSQLDFEIVGDIDGAIDALQTEKANYFMWERFTTKPLVDKGIFRKVGDCPTPWPCFMIAAREEFIIENELEIENMLGVINAKTAGLKELPHIEEEFITRYRQKPEDVKEWLKLTSWSQHQINEGEFQKVQDTLLNLKLISKKLPSLNFIYNFDSSI